MQPANCTWNLRYRSKDKQWQEALQRPFQPIEQVTRGEHAEISNQNVLLNVEANNVPLEFTKIHSTCHAINTDRRSNQKIKNRYTAKSLPSYLHEIEAFLSSDETFINHYDGSERFAQNRKISHEYTDMSILPKEKEVPRVGRGGVLCPFPEKLYEMLEQADRTGYNTIVSWRPHGRAFSVEKPKKFVDLVMPLHFRQTKLTSFQRQLNLYGFRRITRGKDSGAYYHEFFLRGRFDLCKKMIRQKIKGIGRKEASNPDEEPDFYNMPQIHLKNDNKAMNCYKENKDCDQLSTICQSSLESLEPFSFRSSEQPDQMNSSIRDVEQNPPKHARKVREHEKQHKNKSSTSSMVLKLYVNDARDIEQNLICNDVCFNDDNQSEISEVSFLAI